MNIKGFKAKDGNVYKYDFNELANLPETPEGEQGADGGYYTPAVTQPTEDTIQFDFTPSKAGMPAVEPVQVKLPAPDSGGNVDQSGLTTAQIEALHGMFKVCAYDDSKDVSGAYAAFKTAFGITDSGEDEPDEPVVPDEPDTPEVTLSSISATYSGGDVAVGTAVTALTGIVVTAHYSDGTSATVTGYTLSGTIAEGSNIVTVSYGGKSTTFSVTGVASADIPDEVVEMTYADKKMTDCTVYTDEGTSELSVETQAQNVLNGRSISNEVFTEDTNVTITRSIPSSVVWTNLVIGECNESDENIVYNAVTHDFAFTTPTTEKIYTYTVHAGRKLVLFWRERNYNYYTLTVMK